MKIGAGKIIGAAMFAAGVAAIWLWPKPKAEGFVPFVSNYMDVPNEPLYSFGHGLSYSEVAYGPVTLSGSTLRPGERIRASVKLENRGEMASRESVQLYIRDDHASVVRPERELRGLRTVTLQPGECREVSFDITEEMLRFYDAEMRYTSEAGDFTLWIGRDSRTENGAAFRLE